MKKLLALALALSFVFSMVSGTSAEENGEIPQRFLFRNVPWMLGYSETQALFAHESDLQIRENSLKENAEIQRWYDDSDTYASGAKKGGVTVKYSAKVAGFDAVLKVSYIYTLNEDWTVDRSLSSASFCEATYAITGIDNLHEAYKDLREKLSALYGPYDRRSDTNVFTGQNSEEGSYWVAPDGSTIYLKEKLNVIIGTVDGLSLTYAAPGLNDMVYRLANAKELQKREEEQKHMEENATNYDGL